jgi:hypothetical protein
MIVKWRKMAISCSFWKLHAEFFSDLNISTASGLAREPNASFLVYRQCF